MDSGTRISSAGSSRARTTALRVAGTALAALVLVGLTPAVADAAPRRPSDSQIASARAQADAVAARIGALNEQLASAQQGVDAAHASAMLALDEFQATEAAAEAARVHAEQAAAAAAQATADLGVARDDVVSFARRTFMEGSAYPGATALLTAGDPGQLIERAALLEAAGSHRSDVLVQVTVLQEQATAAEAVARTASAEAEQLQQQAAAQLAVAQSAEVSARAQAAELSTQQAAAQTELAAAQQQLTALVGQREAAERAAAVTPVRPPAPTAPPAVANPPAGNPSNAGAGSSSAVETAIAAAMRYRGTPYAWGGGGTRGPGPGQDPDEGVVGFDCSGLTQYAYAQAGISIPRNSRAQYASLPKVSSNDLQRGDLVFWGTDPRNPNAITHVAIYLGGNQVIQAPQSGDVVKVSPMWWGGYTGAVRPSA